MSTAWTLSFGRLQAYWEDKSYHPIVHCGLCPMPLTWCTCVGKSEGDTPWGEVEVNSGGW